MWMEEETSIEDKMQLIKQYDLAGVASWRLGYERASIWDVILKYVNQCPVTYVDLEQIGVTTEQLDMPLHRLEQRLCGGFYFGKKKTGTDHVGIDDFMCICTGRERMAADTWRTCYRKQR